MSNFIDQIVCPLKETGPNNLRNSEAAVIELHDGRLFLAYTHFYADAADYGAGDIRGKISEDGGKTWSQPFMVRPNTARYNTGRLALIRMPAVQSGHSAETEVQRPLGLIYVDLNEFYCNRMYLTTSIDETRSWSLPIQINPNAIIGHTCQRGDTALVLQSGRILVPTYNMFAGLCASSMYYSDNGGDTWQRSLTELSVELAGDAGRIGNADFEEPAVAELSDGRLLCFGRTRMGQLYQSFSENDGLTWSQPEPTGLASSYSPASLKTIPTTGDVLCVWNQASGREIADGLGRMRMSCAISKDDGKTWTHFKNLESLDDTTRVDAEGATDSVSELHAIKERDALKAKATRTRYPEEVTSRYPRWPGYIHNDYPSASFTSTGNVVITYGASDYEMAGLEVGLKLLVRPIDWLYE